MRLGKRFLWPNPPDQLKSGSLRRDKRDFILIGIGIHERKEKWNKQIKI